MITKFGWFCIVLVWACFVAAGCETKVNINEKWVGIVEACKAASGDVHLTTYGSYTEIGCILK